METVMIETIAAASPHCLLVGWSDGTKDQVNLSGWIATGGSVLAALDEERMFAKASIGDFGRSVEWLDCGEDCAIDAVHLKKIAEEQHALDADAINRWQLDLDVSDEEAAAFLGIAFETWKAYKSNNAIPATVAMLLRAAARDPLIFHAHFRRQSTARPRKTA